MERYEHAKAYICLCTVSIPNTNKQSKRGRVLFCHGEGLVPYGCKVEGKNIGNNLLRGPFPLPNERDITCSPPTLTGAGPQRTVSTNTGCNRWLSLAKTLSKVILAGRNRLLVARTSKCGWAIP